MGQRTGVAAVSGRSARTVRLLAAVVGDWHDVRPGECHVVCSMRKARSRLKVAVIVVGVISMRLTGMNALSRGVRAIGKAVHHAEGSHCLDWQGECQQAGKKPTHDGTHLRSLRNPGIPCQCHGKAARDGTCRRQLEYRCRYTLSARCETGGTRGAVLGGGVPKRSRKAGLAQRRPRQSQPRSRQCVAGGGRSSSVSASSDVGGASTR